MILKTCQTRPYTVKFLKKFEQIHRIGLQLTITGMNTVTKQ